MTIICTGEVYEDAGEIEVLCEICLERVGRLSVLDVAGLAKRGEAVWCFECEGTKAEVIPKQLCPAPGEMVILRSEKQSITCIMWDEKDELKCVPALAPDRKGLSSSPYLSHNESKAQGRVAK